MSLLERGPRRGPARGRASWSTSGSPTGRWSTAGSAPSAVRRLASVAGALSGVPTRLRLDRAAEWIFVSAYLRERAVAAGLAVDAAPVVHAGIDPSGFPGRRRAAVGRAPALPRAPRPAQGGGDGDRGARPRCPAARCAAWAAGDDAHRERLGRARRGARRCGRGCASTACRAPRSPGAYAAADALLFCVEWPEPFGLVPLEAMAVGTPVVATGTGGSAEYLRDGENCLAGRAGRRSRGARRRGATAWPATRSCAAAARGRPRDGRRSRRAPLQRGDRGGARAGGAMSAGPQVAIAVVSWNTRDLLARCLESMRADAEAGRAQVWVVDNGSDRRLGGAGPRALRRGRS